MLPARLAPVDRRVDEFDRYVPSRTYFPDGLRPLADRAHGLGLKFGVHVMRGIPRKAVSSTSRSPAGRELRRGHA